MTQLNIKTDILLLLTGLRTLKKERHFSVAFKTNLFNVAARLVNLCTSLTVLGDTMSSRAVTSSVRSFFFIWPTETEIFSL